MSREKHEKNYQNLILIAEAIILVCILCVTVFASAFYSLDAAICDKLYTNFRGVSNDIRIIAIDEETLEAYGNFANWSRQKTADLLQLLCADQENEPAVIGVDILFVAGFQMGIAGVAWATFLCWRKRQRRPARLSSPQI